VVAAQGNGTYGFFPWSNRLFVAKGVGLPGRLQDVSLLELAQRDPIRHNRAVGSFDERLPVDLPNLLKIRKQNQEYFMGCCKNIAQAVRNSKQGHFQSNGPWTAARQRHGRKQGAGGIGRQLGSLLPTSFVYQRLFDDVMYMCAEAGVRRTESD
jgi:hypothetical protein